MAVATSRLGRSQHEAEFNVNLVSSLLSAIEKVRRWMFSNEALSDASEATAFDPETRRNNRPNVSLKSNNSELWKKNRFTATLKH